MLILSSIHKEDSYGYEIAKTIKESSNGLYTIGEGTLYTALKRLEGNDWIQSYWKETQAVPKRKYYCITKLGLHTLQEKWKEWDQITEIVNAYRGGKENE